MDPFTGIASYFLGRLEQKVFQAWIRLIFQMGISALITGCLTWGTAGAAAIYATHSASIGLAIGFCAALVMISVVLGNYIRTAPETKGMRFVFPSSEAALELGAELQTITRSK
jgi:hypothetical protein